MKKTPFIIIASALILTACATPPTPTVTLVPPTQTPIPPSQTPLPPTQIPATPTPEGIAWITVENIEDYADNPLNDADLKPGGKFDQYWKQTLKPELMEETEWDIIKDDIPFIIFSGSLIYSTEEEKGEKFVNPDTNPNVPDTNPFDRNIGAFGLYTAGNGREYLFIPLVIRDIDAPTETGHDLYVIKLLLPLQKNDGTPLTQDQIDYMIETWKTKMNIAPIGINNKPMDKLSADDDGANAEDPTFDHLKKGSYTSQIRILVFSALLEREPVHGPLNEFKKLQDFLFSTEVSILVNMDGTSNNTYR